MHRGNCPGFLGNVKGKTMESKIDRLNRIARILRESFAHVAPRETLTVPNAHWVALAWEVYRPGMSDEDIANAAIDAVFPRHTGDRA